MLEVGFGAYCVKNHSSRKPIPCIMILKIWKLWRISHLVNKCSLIYLTVYFNNLPLLYSWLETAKMSSACYNRLSTDVVKWIMFSITVHLIVFWNLQFFRWNFVGLLSLNMMFIGTVIILTTGCHFLCEDCLCKLFDKFWKITKIGERKIMFYFM